MRGLPHRLPAAEPREEFLANISHELRTPLNVIFGYTDILLEDERDAERRHTLGRVRLQSEQLLQLVRDLMTLSGLNAGKIALELSRVDVRELVDRVRPLAEQLAHGRPIAAVFECATHVPVAAWGSVSRSCGGSSRSSAARWAS